MTDLTMRNKRIYAGFLLLCLTLVSLQAQNRRGKFDVNAFHENKWEFMLSDVGLSPAEINAVKPVFMDYEKKNWELHDQTRQLFRQSRSGKLNENQYRDLNNKMINNEIKRSQYLREYHLKLRKLLKPETLFNYYGAEKKFERQLLRKRPGSPPPAPDK